MAELADAHDLGSCGATRGGSSPLIRTSYILELYPEKNRSLKSICIEINPDFYEHKEVIEILKKDFKNYKKFGWDKNQEIFNYIFER